MDEYANILFQAPGWRLVADLDGTRAEVTLYDLGEDTVAVYTYNNVADYQAAIYALLFNDSARLEFMAANG